MDTTANRTSDVRLLIGGELVAGADGTYPVHNPARPDEIALQAPAASHDQVNEAMAAAGHALAPDA